MRDHCQHTRTEDKNIHLFQEERHQTHEPRMSGQHAVAGDEGNEATRVLKDNDNGWDANRTWSYKTSEYLFYVLVALCG